MAPHFDEPYNYAGGLNPGRDHLITADSPQLESGSRGHCCRVEIFRLNTHVYCLYHIIKKSQLFDFITVKLIGYVVYVNHMLYSMLIQLQITVLLYKQKNSING
jgi:hypothetical protein